MTPSQARMARAALRLGVRDVAELAKITPATVTRFETEKGGLNAKTLASLKGSLEAAGIVFIPENGGPAGVRYLAPPHDSENLADDA